MEFALDPVSFTSSPAPDLPGDGNPTSAQHALRLLESADLLQGNKAIAIVHKGARYRLQVTRLDKLILTK